MNAVNAAGLGLGIILIILIIRWKLRNLHYKTEAFEQDCSPNPVHVLHRLCPHHNVVQHYEVEEKDSLDEHLDVLTRKLADKEGRLRLSKSKIRETQNEIENLHAIDHDVKARYREIMDSLRTDLMTNEKECKKLQEQIEWVSRRRAELKDEVHQGQMLFGEAAAELASNLAEMQRCRVPEQDCDTQPQVTESHTSATRVRKEQNCARAVPVCSVIKNDSTFPSSTNTNGILGTEGNARFRTCTY